jgi:hypothetical protein
LSKEGSFGGGFAAFNFGRVARFETPGDFTVFFYLSTTVY